MCIHPKQPYISKKNDQKNVSFQNAGQQKSFRKKSREPKFEKPLFHNSIKFGSKLKNMNTFTLFFEITFDKKKIYCSKMAAKTVL